MGTYTNSSRVLKRLCDLWIHSYQEILLFGNFEVAGFDLTPDPLGEGLTDDTVRHVDDELLRQLGDLLDHRHVEAEPIFHTDIPEHVLDVEALILWDRQVLQLICHDI